MAAQAMAQPMQERKNNPRAIEAPRSARPPLHRCRLPIAGFFRL
jgi:hypothetical protein